VDETSNDRWGPGVRVPAIIISPYAKRGFVDHTPYETVSILKLIETRWNLAHRIERSHRERLSHRSAIEWAPGEAQPSELPPSHPGDVDVGPSHRRRGDVGRGDVGPSHRGRGRPRRGAGADRRG